MICPQCTNEVPVTEAQYLSMYTCPKCQAVYFLDLVGHPEFADMTSAISDIPQAIEQPQENVDLNANEMISEISFEQPVAPEELQSFDSAALEITDYANQDNSISAVSYDLKVSGLDTKETMFLFREAIEDSRFGWISQEIVSEVKNGQYEFKNLNPILAFILAKRIQFLNIEMEWQQNVQN